MFRNVAFALSGLLLAACGDGANDAATDPAVIEDPINEDGVADIFTATEIDETRAKIREAVDVALSTRGKGKPAMWTLGDDDTTIHIFGTIHILPPGLDWRSDKFNAAFAASDKLVMETVDGDPAEEEALLARMLSNAVYPAGETLEDKLSEADFQRVSVAAKDIGVPVASMSQMRPWFAAVSIELVLAFEQGYEEDSGVEVVLEKEAVAAGKQLGGLETSEFQMTLFENMSERAQLEYLVSSAATIDMARDTFKVDLDEWLDGDVAGQSVFMDPAVMGTSEGAEEFTDLLIRDRNTAWIPQIEAMLDEPGTVMIAVGAGHLAGPDSVILMLRDKGYTVDGP